MPLVEFSHTVKYRGAFYAPNTPVMAKEEDMEELSALGAKVLPQIPQDAEKASKPQAKTSAMKKPYKIPPPNKEK